ncbi:MAG TPA: EAL domain-containing response regulator [Usitatibacter sp.]|nr:EAL domain-containing response regulator [Usitatibacter sp.]
MDTESLELDISGLRFLVVEDQGFQRWAVAHLLEGLGAKVVLSATDGADALEIYRNAEPPIDIVVSDLNMPGMDGMEFIRHLGGMGNKVAVILASDLDKALVASVATMTQAYGIELLEAMQKPITGKKLAAALRRYQPRMKLESVDPTVFGIEEIVEGLRGNEFEPYFLPKMNLQTQVIVGAEAVARWRHPQRGTVLPAAFIPLLETSAEAMDYLTQTIVRKAAAACRQWHDEGREQHVAVNVSLISLTDVSLAERMTQLIAEEGLEPRDVVFEVTETAAASHLGKVLENLSRLRMKGFGLAIDDYGTGYSSMQQLTHIPFTELKIDQTFVRKAATQRSSRAVLESSLEMASKLRIQSVGEGVETKEQLVLLRELGCHLAQGFLIGKPMRAAEFSRFAASGGRG